MQELTVLTASVRKLRAELERPPVAATQLATGVEIVREEVAQLSAEQGRQGADHLTTPIEPAAGQPTSEPGSARLTNTATDPLNVALPATEAEQPGSAQPGGDEERKQ